mgnify:CR=1 FL=1
MYELLPSFQSQTKAEFMTGKDGIGPYALATTNLAFTQTAHLTIDFGHLGEIYDLGALKVGESRVFINCQVLLCSFNANLGIGLQILLLF